MSDEELSQRDSNENEDPREGSFSGTGSDSGDLDEDDLDLLEENIGTSARRPKRFKRIRRFVESDEEVEPVKKDHRNLENMFESDDEDAIEEEEEASDLEDFIESDEEDEVDKRRSQVRRPAPRKQRKSQDQNVSTDVMQEMLDIFGDGYDYAVSSADAREPESFVEPSLIMDHLFTNDDEKIRMTDLPERLQLATMCRDFAEEPTVAAEDDLRAESVWVATKLSQSEPSPDAIQDETLLKRLNARAANRKQFLASVAAIVKWLGHDGFEVPFVASNRKEQYVDFLDLTDLWTIYDLDQIWQRSQKYKKRLLYNLRTIRPMVSSEYQPTIAEFVSRLEDRGANPQEEDIMDVCWDIEEYLSGHPQILKSIGESSQRLPSFRTIPGLVLNGRQVHQNILRDFLNIIGINPKNYGRNLIDRVKIMEPEDHDLSPETVSSSLISDVLPDSLSVIDKAVSDLAFEFSLDLNVRRGIRSLNFFDLSVAQTSPPSFQASDMIYVSVNPTAIGHEKLSALPVAGVLSASPDQLYWSLARVQYLRDKPLTHISAEEAALLFHGEQEGLVEIHLRLILRPDAKKELEGLITSERYSPNAEEWNPLRCQMLNACLEHFMFPRLLLRLKDNWKILTTKLVGSWIEMSLMTRLISTPPSFVEGGREPDAPEHIVAISNGEGGRGPSVAVCIDREGRCIKYQVYHQLGHVHPSERMFSDDFQMLARFIHETQPSLVVVSGWNQSTRMLYNDITRFIQELKDGSFVIRPTNEDRSARSVSTDTRLPAYLRVAYQKDDLARIYMDTDKGKTDAEVFNVNPAVAQLFAYCLSLARRALDPCIEWANVLTDSQNEIDDSVLSMITDLNPRQGLLSHLFREHVTRSLVNVVNLLGVDLHRALNSPWYFSILPFICGLGPKKAIHLKTKLIQQNYQIYKRNDFVVQRLFGRRVFLNSASFIRITEDYLPHFSSKRKGDREKIDVLDATRIHPENYQWARKMAADALDKDSSRYEDDSRLVAELMKTPERLQSLLLEEYAQELEKKTHVQKGITLLDIKSELLSPYHDVRQDVSQSFEEPSLDELFDMLVGISKVQFYQLVYPGALLSGQIHKINPKSAMVKLDNLPKVTGSVFIKNIADSYVETVEDLLHVNQRIPYLKVIGIQKDKFLIDLTMKASEIFPRGMPPQPNAAPPVELFSNLLREEKRPYVDGYYDFESEEVHVRAEKTKRDRQFKAQVALSGGMTPSIGNLAKPSLPQRNIQHRLFRSYNRVQAEHALSKMHDGDIIIRPSSKGLSFIVFSWRLALGVYQHLDIKEDAKDTPFSLGKRLYVNDEVFEDLDEVVTRVVQPLLEFCQLIIHHPKYVDVQTESEVEKLLVNSQKEDPKRIHYFFSISRDFPGKFILSWMPSSKVYHEYITVVSRGYRFKRMQFEGINDLINWFKQDFMKRASQVPSSSQPQKSTPVQNIIRTR